MGTSADQIVSSILRNEDCFLIATGMFVDQFREIEHLLATDAVRLGELSADEDLKTATDVIARLQILEKRDLLKRIIAEIGRFYDVDCAGAIRVLDELGNPNRLRRTIVHGRIEWSLADERPTLVDHHGQVLSAWPHDLADASLRLVNWRQDYYSELAKLMRSTLRAYDQFAERLLRHPKLPPKCRALFSGIQQAARAELI